MRYIKVLLLVLLIFFSLVFFFQNQTALSTAMTLKLNLFFVPEMTSIPLPFYFIVIVAFFVGAAGGGPAAVGQDAPDGPLHEEQVACVRSGT